jgi:hypothetical protein
MSPVLGMGFVDIFYYLGALWIVVKLYAVGAAWWRGRALTTPLQGPTSRNILFGLYRYINQSEDPGALYEGWASEYGPAFKVPGGFGTYKIMICDPKANAHFYSKETFGYVQPALARTFIENLVSYSGLLASIDWC